MMKGITTPLEYSMSFSTVVVVLHVSTFTQKLKLKWCHIWILFLWLREMQSFNFQWNMFFLNNKNPKVAISGFCFADLSKVDGDKKIMQ
jgi:hypothetical protein